MPPATLRYEFVYLSNEALHNPCQGIGTEMTCGRPIDALGANGVLVTWSADGSPAWNFKSFRQAKGRLTNVGGRPAKILFQTSGCGSLGANESIDVVIPNGRFNWFQMDACVRGPDVGATVLQVISMLHTVRFD